MYNIEHSQVPLDIITDIYNQYLSENGFFVDVGAFDGVTCSNTRSLAESGWSGLLIEPLPEAYLQLENLYRNNNKITTINCGISNKEEILNLYQNGMISTFRTFGLPFYRLTNRTQSSIICYTLEYILNKHNVSKIDVLSIDVEGFEDKVMDSFDIERYKPALCIIELHAGIYNGKESEFKDIKLIQNCESYLTNYKLIYSDHINNIYVRNNDNDRL